MEFYYFVTIETVENTLSITVTSLKIIEQVFRSMASDDESLG